MMAYYRLYSLDLRAKHFTDVVHFDAECDAAAILTVKPDVLGISRELWNQERKVMDFDPRTAPSSHREAARQFSKLLGSVGCLIWNPLNDHCLAVANPKRQLNGDRLTAPLPDPKTEVEHEPN